MNADAFRRLASHAPQCQPADLALALTTLWLGRLCNRMDYAAGFIFMRRMGSAALNRQGRCSTSCLWRHIDARETLADLAMRLAAQLKRCAAISAMTPSRSSATAAKRQGTNRCSARC